MKTLWLLRHAKADGGQTADHERPLSASGLAVAADLGRTLAERGERPARVLCSSALRTRQTFECIEEAFDGDVEVEFERDLYLAGAEEIHERIESLPDAVESLLLIGHNPGIAEAALRLARRGPPEALRELRSRYPAGALATLRPDSERWAELQRGCELVDFTIPRERA